MVNLSYNNFEMLPPTQQKSMIVGYQISMGDWIKPEVGGPKIHSGEVVIQFYGSVLGRDIGEGLTEIIEKMDFDKNYKHCITCGGIYEENFNGKKIGIISPIPYLLAMFAASSGFCTPECLSEAKEINRRARYN